MKSFFHKNRIRITLILILILSFLFLFYLDSIYYFTNKYKTLLALSGPLVTILVDFYLKNQKTKDDNVKKSIHSANNIRRGYSKFQEDSLELNFQIEQNPEDYHSFISYYSGIYSKLDDVIFNELQYYHHDKHICIKLESNHDKLLELNNILRDYTQPADSYGRYSTNENIQIDRESNSTNYLDSQLKLMNKSIEQLIVDLKI